MDRLTSMAVFKKAVDEGSFAAAARHFAMSAEMAGHHVRALETRLGVRLLNRTTRRLHLTEPGRVFYERCALILSTFAEAEAEAAARQATPTGPLRVAAPRTFGSLVLAPLVSEFVRRYPDVTVNLVTSHRFANLVEEGFDVAIRIGDLPDSGLIARRLGTSRLIACASPGYIAVHDAVQEPQDLGGHPCLIYTETAAPNTWGFRDHEGQRQTVQVSGSVSASDMKFLHCMALDGHGVLLAPDYVVREDLGSGRLTQLLPAWQLRELPIRALYPQGKLTPSKVRSFVDLLVEYLAPA